MLNKIIDYLKKRKLEHRANYCFKCAESEREYARQATRNAAWFESEALQAVQARKWISTLHQGKK